MNCSKGSDNGSQFRRTCKAGTFFAADTGKASPTRPTGGRQDA